MMNDVFYHYIVYVFFIASLVVLGTLVCKFCFRRFLFSCGTNFFLNLSLKLLLGFITVVSVTAIVITRGKTIYLFTLLLLLLGAFIRTKLEYGIKPIQISSGKPKDYLLVFFVFTLIFVWHYLGTNYSGDMMFYAKVSNALMDYGVENYKAIYYEYRPVKGILLYHYGELWLTGIISRIMDTSSLNVLIYFTYPFFHGLTLISLIGVFVSKGFATLKSFLVSVAVLYGISIIQYQIFIIPHQ